MGRGSADTASALLFGKPEARQHSQLDVDERHMLDGGEIEHTESGATIRTINGVLHCDYGPALEGVDGQDDLYYIEGIQVDPPAEGKLPSLPEPIGEEVVVDVAGEPARSDAEALVADALGVERAGEPARSYILQYVVVREKVPFDTAYRRLLGFKRPKGQHLLLAAFTDDEASYFDSRALRAGYGETGADGYRVYTAKKKRRQRS